MKWLGQLPHQCPGNSWNSRQLHRWALNCLWAKDIFWQFSPASLAGGGSLWLMQRSHKVRDLHKSKSYYHATRVMAMCQSWRPKNWAEGRRWRWDHDARWNWHSKVEGWHRSGTWWQGLRRPVQSQMFPSHISANEGTARVVKRLSLHKSKLRPTCRRGTWELCIGSWRSAG